MKTRRALIAILISLLFMPSLFAQAVRNFKQTGPATQSLDAPGLAIAHPSLPLGTQVQVTNNTSGQKTTATVASRIPASPDRITDVSSALASAIGLPGSGASVTIEVVDSRNRRSNTPPPPVEDIPVEVAAAPPPPPEPEPEPEMEPEPEPEPPYEPPRVAEAPRQPAETPPDRLTIVYPPYYPPYPQQYPQYPPQATMPQANQGQDLTHVAEPSSSTSASPVIAPSPAMSSAPAPSTSSNPSIVSPSPTTSNSTSPVTTTAPTNTPTSTPTVAPTMMGPTVVAPSAPPQNSTSQTPNIMVIPIYTNPPGSDRAASAQPTYTYSNSPQTPELPAQPAQPAASAPQQSWAQPVQQAQPAPAAPAPNPYAAAPQPEPSRPTAGGPAAGAQPPQQQQPGSAWQTQQQNPWGGQQQQQNSWTAAQQNPWSGPSQQPQAAARPPQQQVLDYTRPPALVRPSMPPANSSRNYRVQVGAYRSTINAREAFDYLVNAGFNPAYERYGDVYRVVLSGVRAYDMNEVARLLGAAGFREVIVREE